MYNARWPKTYRHSGLILRKVSPGCIECKEQVLNVLFLETMVYFRKIIHSTMKVGMSNFYHFQFSQGNLFILAYIYIYAISVLGCMDKSWRAKSGKSDLGEARLSRIQGFLQGYYPV